MQLFLPSTEGNYVDPYYAQQYQPNVALNSVEGEYAYAEVQAVKDRNDLIDRQLEAFVAGPVSELVQTG